MSLAFIAFLIAAILFAIEGVRSRSLLAWGLFAMALGHMLAGHGINLS